MRLEGGIRGSRGGTGGSGEEVGNSGRPGGNVPLTSGLPSNLLSYVAN